MAELPERSAGEPAREEGISLDELSRAYADALGGGEGPVARDSGGLPDAAGPQEGTEARGRAGGDPAACRSAQPPLRVQRLPLPDYERGAGLPACASPQVRTIA